MNFTEKQNVIFWTEIWTWRTQVMGEALFHIRLYHSTCNLASPSIRLETAVTALIQKGQCVLLSH